MNDRSGDGIGDFEVKMKTNTAKFTNMIIARFREREQIFGLTKYLLSLNLAIIRDKTKVASTVSSNQ